MKSVTRYDMDQATTEKMNGPGGLTYSIPDDGLDDPFDPRFEVQVEGSAVCGLEAFLGRCLERRGHRSD